MPMGNLHMPVVLLKVFAMQLLKEELLAFAASKYLKVIPAMPLYLS